LAVLLLGEDQPPCPVLILLAMLAAERDAVTTAARHRENEFDREPRLGAERMVRAELRDLLIGPGVMALRVLGLGLDALGGINLDKGHGVDGASTSTADDARNAAATTWALSATQSDRLAHSATGSLSYRPPPTHESGGRPS